MRIRAASCDDGSWTGSGFVTSQDVVVTAAHVASGARTLTVQTGEGALFEAEPIAIVPRHDVALLRLEEALVVSPLSLAESLPDRGSDLAVLGYPLGTYDLRITGPDPGSWTR